jgi:hypothetical protein
LASSGRTSRVRGVSFHFPLKNCHSPYSRPFVTAISTILLLQPAPTRVRVHPWPALCMRRHRTRSASALFGLTRSRLTHTCRATIGLRLRPASTSARVQAAQLPCARPSPWSRLIPSRRLASPPHACTTRRPPGSCAHAPLVVCLKRLCSPPHVPHCLETHLRVPPLARTLRPFISSVTRLFHQASTITPPSSAIMGHPSSNGRPLLLL